MPPLANGSSPSIPAAESGRPKKPENYKKNFKAQTNLKNLLNYTLDELNVVLPISSIKSS
jgi:hypothetical protein